MGDDGILHGFSKAVYDKSELVRHSNSDFMYNGGLLLDASSTDKNITVYTMTNQKTTFDFMTVNSLVHQAVL